jgi:hypothetical protein
MRQGDEHWSKTFYVLSNRYCLQPTQPEFVVFLRQSNPELISSLVRNTRKFGILTLNNKLHKTDISFLEFNLQFWV